MNKIIHTVTLLLITLSVIVFVKVSKDTLNNSSVNLQAKLEKKHGQIKNQETVQAQKKNAIELKARRARHAKTASRRNHSNKEQFAYDVPEHNLAMNVTDSTDLASLNAESDFASVSTQKSDVELKLWKTSPTEFRNNI